jgi:DNA (cytosine-5)-methyltransferase 1
MNVDFLRIGVAGLAEIIEPLFTPGSLRVLIGGPPCQGFSAHRKKDPRLDRRNSLIEFFACMAIELRADYVVLENVPDLCSDRHGHHYAAYHKRLTTQGYFLSADILNFATFGVPQERYRTVSIASKHGIPLMPTPIFERSDFMTVRNAIGGLTPLSAGQISRVDPMHKTSNHRPKTVDILRSVPKDGGSRPYGVGPECLDRTRGFSDVYGRLSWDKPSITMTARCRTPSCGRFAHPTQNRGLTIREASLLQGFPSEWMFCGPFDDMFKQVGNAVPPPASVAIAKIVLETIETGKYLSSFMPIPSTKGFRSVAYETEMKVKAS